MDHGHGGNDQGERLAKAPLALVQDGDPGSMNIPEGTLGLLVSEEVLARRRTQWRPSPPNKGFLGLYASVTSSANVGTAWRMPKE